MPNPSTLDTAPLTSSVCTQCSPAVSADTTFTTLTTNAAGTGTATSKDSSSRELSDPLGTWLDDGAAGGKRSPSSGVQDVSQHSSSSQGGLSNNGSNGLHSSNSCGASSPVNCDSVSNKRKRDTMGVQDMKPPVNRVDFGDYYPDGGWGWVVLGAATLVHMLCNGFQLAFGTLFLRVMSKFAIDDWSTAWLGSLGMAISLFIAPVVTIICRRKSPRLYGVIGGLICSLGCLFQAFSTQPEQLFISHCLVMSIGSGVTVVTANIMVGRYFRQRRELAEMILVAGSGVGAAIMSTLFEELIKAIEWMHGLQCVAGLLILTIISGALYRSASLYHPRRKVILHLKSQKKNRRDREAEKPPYLDFSALKMRSLRALMVISAIIGLGIHVPFILLVRTAQISKEAGARLFLLNVYLGLGFVLGCMGLGYITIRNSNECHISRRHQCQSSAILCGLFTLLLILANDESSFVLYAWAYGICCGSYYYSLKTYVYELVKTKLMERSWSFLCAANSVPVLIGAPAACYLNTGYDNSTSSRGYIFAGVSMIVGGLLLFVMPFFERHPSNNEVLQKHSSSLYPSHLTEAAALLDIDFTDGCPSGKHPHHQKGHASNGLTPPKHSTSSSTSKGDEGGGVKVQLQCLVQHKERERPAKQIPLTKITEEKDGVKLCTCDSSANRNGMNVNANRVEFSVTKTDYSDAALDGLSGDSSMSNAMEKSSSKDNSGGFSRMEGKKSKKSEVRIELFDPPSQEKESTATVSYDSDLYINLCEAQV